MTDAAIEHVNITVSDPAKTAQMLCEIFGWRVRWEGPSKMGGRTVHVGTEKDYLAVYTYDAVQKTQNSSYSVTGGLNHVGVVVDDLEAVEARVKAAGHEPFNHGEYEPGRRFYFKDHDGIEFEVVSYQ